MSTLKFEGLKKLNSNIRAIKSKGAKLSALIHSTAIQALLHASSKGADGLVINDARPMDQLLQALPNGMRAEGFKIWVQKYSPIRWNGDGQVSVMKETAKTYTKYDVEAANNEPFWAASKENEVKKLSLEALQKLIAQKTNEVLSADADGTIYGKDGEVKTKLDGNVLEMKDYAKKLQTAASSIVITHFPEVKNEVPSALTAAMSTSKALVTVDELKSETKIGQAA